MTEAESWVQAVQARGVVLRLRNGRLSLHPAKSYSQLSDEEHLTLRRCRSEIKALVESGVYPPPVPQAATPAARVEVPIPPCPYCNRVCIGESHPEYRTLHFMDAAEIKKRDEAATRVMFMTVGTPGRNYGF